MFRCCSCSRSHRASNQLKNQKRLGELLFSNQPQRKTNCAVPQGWAGEILVKLLKIFACWLNSIQFNLKANTHQPQGKTDCAVPQGRAGGKYWLVGKSLNSTCQQVFGSHGDNTHQLQGRQIVQCQRLWSDQSWWPIIFITILWKSWRKYLLRKAISIERTDFSFRWGTIAWDVCKN